MTVHINSDKLPDKYKPYASTLDMYKQDGKFTEERENLHIKIIDEFLGEALNDERFKDVKPNAIWIGGGAASGKSVSRNTLISIHEKKGKKFVVIDVDEIKKKLPEYHEIIDFNKEEAANFVHKESQQIGDKIIDVCIKNKLNYALEGTMSNWLSYFNWFDDHKKDGYKIHIGISTCPVELALEREKERSERTKRKVNEKFLRESHKGSTISAFTLMKKADSMVIIDTRGNYPEVIFSKESVYSPYNIKNVDKMKEFCDKGEVKYDKVWEKSIQAKERFLISDLER